jgi:hypothetical protein
MSWSIVPGNRRHVHLDIKPVGAPVFREVRLAAGRDLDSRKPSSCILPARIESAAHVVCLVISAIVKLNDVRHND